MTAALRVLGLAGSLRRQSLNRRLLDAAAALAPDGLHVARYGALGDVPLFDEDVERDTGGGPASVRALRDAVAAADGVLIATPEYNQSFPGVLKNAIDWLSRAAPDEVLAGKPVALIGATAGRWGTRLSQAGLRHVLAATESLVMPAPALFLAGGEPLFDVDGRLREPADAAQLARVLAAFERWIAGSRAATQALQPPIGIQISSPPMPVRPSNPGP